MFKEHARTVTGVVMAVDLAIVTGAFVAAHWLRAEALPGLGIVGRPFYPLDRYLPLLPLALVVWGTLLWRSGEYRSRRTVPISRELLDLLRVCAMGGVLMSLVIYLFRVDRAVLDGDALSRSWIVLFTGLTFSGLAAEKLVLRWTAHLVRTHGYNFRTILVVGTSDSALAIADAIRRHRYWGYRLLGFLSETRRPPGGILGVPLLGTVDELERLTLELPVDEVICASRTRDEERDRRILRRLQELGISVRFTLDLPPQGVRGPELSEFDGVPLVTYSSVPAREAHLMLKRLVDVAIAGLALVLLLPLLALIALLIKHDSEGPVLFRQQRIGLNGRRFTLLKFRTMVVGAEARRAEFEPLNEMDGPVFKLRDDPRVTLVGRFLRRTSVDELPQLWNVLKGDMSLVGPRPMVPFEVERLERWERRRLSMRPGMTCLWQVQGRNDLVWDRWVELDMEYIDSWTPWLDLKILLRTIPAVLSRRGAS